MHRGLYVLANHRCGSNTDEIEVFAIEAATREGYAGQLLTLESLNPRNSYLRTF